MTYAMLKVTSDLFVKYHVCMKIPSSKDTNIK